MTRAAERFRRLTTPAPGQTAVDLVRVYARHDVQVFSEYAIEDQRSCQSIVLAPHHRMILDCIRYAWEHNLHAVCLSPWGSGKTALLEAVLAFVLGNDTTIRAKLASASRDAANARVTQVGNVIANGLRYQSVFPTVRPGEKWSDGVIVLERLTTARDASLQGFGTESKAMGTRADLLALDDLNDESAVRSERRRQQTGALFYSKFLSRLDGNSRLVKIASRWHDDDVVGVLLRESVQRQLYCFLTIRCILAGPLKGQCLTTDVLLPGTYPALKYVFSRGLGWAPPKAAFLADLRARIEAEAESDIGRLDREGAGQLEVGAR